MALVSSDTQPATAAQVEKAALPIGAVAFIHCFGSSLNGHVHGHVCAVDGVVEEVPVAVAGDAQSSPPGIVFHPASAIDEATVSQVQTDPVTTREGAPGVAPLGHPMPPTPVPAPPKRSKACGPPLWDDCDAQMDGGEHIEPADWDLAVQAAPDYEIDQRINWWPGKPVTQTRWRVAMRTAYPAHR